MKAHGITGETFDHKISAVFDKESEAIDAVEKIRQHTDLRDAQIFLINPRDRRAGKRLEPEDKGIWRTLLRAHLWLGIAGAAVGLLLYVLLMAIGIPFIRANPTPSAIILLAFGIIGGMMLGGLVTIRPDHDPYLISARKALREGKYVVAVHAASLEQQQQAKKILDDRSEDTTRSL